MKNLLLSASEAVKAAATVCLIGGQLFYGCAGAPRYTHSTYASVKKERSGAVRNNGCRPADESGAAVSVKKSDRKNRATYYQTGKASYYANKFQGRKTASGERYSHNKLTAAHRKLPFGTMVRVTNLDNGKSVIVRINDRGPMKRERVIDLSRSAAGKIALIKAGVASVGIEIVEE